MVAGVVSGAPSTAWALVRVEDPLEAAWAAGRLLVPHQPRGVRLFAAAVVVHSAFTFGWTIVLAHVLPGRATRAGRAAAGATAGLGIAALDLGAAHLLRSRARFAPVDALDLVPQLADHVAFGALVGALLDPS